MAAYSNDLRWQMAYKRLGLDFSYRTIAGNLGIDSSTVYRIVELFLRTGDMEKKYEGCNRRNEVFYYSHCARQPRHNAS